MKYAVFLILILLIGCKNNSNNSPKPTYTIKGQVLNGSTGQTYANQPISAEVHTATKPSTSADLGTGMTDAQGNFSISYTQTSVNYSQASILINSNFFQLDGIPVNKNVDSIFYLSSKGSLKIYLKTNTPLEINKDTLFIGLANPISFVVEVDTITKTINGYYKTIITPPPMQPIAWGRGWNKFLYDPVAGRFRTGSNYHSIHITGDPYVDTVTVNY